MSPNATTVSTFRPGVCAWLCVSFGGCTSDQRELIETEYDGLRLFIKPSPPESKWGNQIAVFMDRPNETDRYNLGVNRLLSAMAWRDRRGYETLGNGSASGCRCDDPGEPRFLFFVPRERQTDVVHGPFDFDHLPTDTSEEQRLALALYRDALCCNNVFYRFLNFFKIINLRHPSGPAQKAWIRSALSTVSHRLPNAKSRLDELLSRVPDVATYLYEQNRCAIAHAGFSTGRDIRDPDVPSDRAAVSRDLDLAQELAEIFIEGVLGVPSMSTVWREHLYELSGFKLIFGASLVERLRARDTVPSSEFPALPLVDLRLKRKPPYSGLDDVRLAVAECRDGVVLLGTEPGPVSLAIALNFPEEHLELLLEQVGVSADHPDYCPALEISVLTFLRDYISNGSLEVRESAGGQRLSLKNPFLPDFSWRGAVRDIEARIAQLARVPSEDDRGQDV